MKIGIDARMLGPQCGGLGRYVEQLVFHLQKIDQENQYFLFMKQDNWHRFSPVEKNFVKVMANIPWYSWTEQLKLTGIIKAQGIDLMHFPHWNVPMMYPSPFVLTIHDLIMFHYPRQEATTLSPFKYWCKDWAHRRVVNHAAAKAEKIIAASESTRQDINRTLDVPIKKIKVIYQAPFKNWHLENITPAVSATRKLTVLKKFDISKPYVLYVGNAYPHKNLTGLLSAWQIFKQKYGNKYQLVLVGKKSKFYEKVLSGFVEDVVFTDFVEDEDLAIIYENAYLYVFPSLYEGFGLPPLEAMNYGVPVISSNRSCLPEVLGEAVLYFDPENYEQMAEVMHLALENKDIQMELQENARQHVKSFSWDRLARQTLDIYQEVKN